MGVLKAGGGGSALPLQQHAADLTRRWSLQLLELFGGTRDDWIAEDLEGWLAPNEIYEGMGAALQHLQAQHELYIVTTKQVGHVCRPDSICTYAPL